MEEDFRALLNSVSGVPSFYRRAPISVKERPYISLTVASHPTDYALDSETRNALIQADLWADSYGAAVALSRTVHAALSGYHGRQGGTLFQGIFAEAERDLSGDVGEAVVYARSIDWRVHYQTQA